MCIIVAKNKGIKMPSKDVLKNCFDYNSDGAGYMYVKNGKVYINKGFMTFDKFYESLEKLNRIHNLDKHAIVMHFRISTAGNVDGGNCHPYPITNNEKHLRKENFVTDIGMAHNGIISQYSKGKGKLNDTQLFIKECVSVFKDLSKDFLKHQGVMKILEDIAGSKLCFLDSDENIHLVGDFIEDDGVMYSNASYLTRYYYPYTYYGSSSYGNKKLDKYDDYYGTESYRYYGDDVDDYYNSLYDDMPYMLENKIIDDTDSEKLTENQFLILMDELYPLDVGQCVMIGYDEYEVGTEGVFYIDNFFNLYKVDSKEFTIDLIEKDVALLS
jgi:predicted glutamine amidotransferase